MSSVVGIDLSSFAVDLVRLDETENNAEWERVTLVGKIAWDRTLELPEAMPAASWYDDVYLVAIEAPYGSRQPGTTAILNRIVGAIVATLPSALRVPERCWIVRPDEWKTELALKKKPTTEDIERLLPGLTIQGPQTTLFLQGPQDQWDALCLALYARRVNARAVALAAAW